LTPAAYLDSVPAAAGALPEKLFWELAARRINRAKGAGIRHKFCLLKKITMQYLN
jgi:hypothetical protein